jgi:hypothetical protein
VRSPVEARTARRTCRRHDWPAVLGATGAALAAITASFLPWYWHRGYLGHHFTDNGWATPHEGYSILALVASVSAAGFVIAFAALVPASDREARRFGMVGGLIGSLGALAAICFVLAKRHQELRFGAHRDYGFTVAIVAALVLLGSSVLLWLDRGRTGT